MKRTTDSSGVTSWQHEKITARELGQHQEIDFSTAKGGHELVFTLRSLGYKTERNGIELRINDRHLGGVSKISRYGFWVDYRIFGKQHRDYISYSDTYIYAKRTLAI